MKALVAAVLILSGTASHAALLGRAPLTLGGDDYQAYYDDALNITWTADANLAASETFGISRSSTLVPGSNQIGSQGRMNWQTAKDWIAAMNGAAYLGQTGWRLPSVVDSGPLGCDFAYTGTDCGYNVDLGSGEIAHLFYSSLGNVGRYATDGSLTGCSSPYFPSPSCLANRGPFSNLEPVDYHSGTTYLPNVDFAWRFYFNVGYQDYGLKEYTDYYAWAVINGDPLAATVPVPAATWLFGGALGLLPLVRRRRAQCAS